MTEINLCSNCAANNEGKCCIYEIKIKKGRNRCNDYANANLVFVSPLYEYLEEHNYC